MTHPDALFSLLPLNDRATLLVNHPENNTFRSTLKSGEAVLQVGHVRSACGNPGTLVTLGRAGDIYVTGSNMAKIQCSFEIHPETGVLMFYDRSLLQTSEVLGEGVVPFEAGRPRRILIEKEKTTSIAMGGETRDLVGFEIVWHHNDPKATAAKVKAWEAAMPPPDPRLARTMEHDASDTVVPSGMATRIHTRDCGLPKMRWKKAQEEPLGSGAFGTVYKALDYDSGRLMAVKIMKCSPAPSSGKLWLKLKREVEILADINHVCLSSSSSSMPRARRRANCASRPSPTSSTPSSHKVGRMAKPKSSWD